MTLDSFVHGALAELTLDDLDRMLRLDESLFVEHKSDLGDAKDSFGLVKSVSAFANTLGGWLLFGVRDGKPNGSTASWASDGAPTLADSIRDRLRHAVDPLPAFEARLMAHPEGAVGVVRVYESADTPHVTLQSGAVFVREGAGVTDAATSGQPGSGARAQRAFAAREIRSRAQLLELATRGTAAERRVHALLDPANHRPLTNERLALKPPGSTRPPQPFAPGGSIFVRLAPFTLPPHSRSWVTTDQAAAAAVGAADQLAGIRGHLTNLATPHQEGVSVELQVQSGLRHSDDGGKGLASVARLTLDAVGIAGAALNLAPPDESLLRTRVQMNTLGDDFVRPVVEAALAMLADSGFVGRVRCRINLERLAATFALAEGGPRNPANWITHDTDLALPVDDHQLRDIARRASYAYARSAGVPAWDPHIGEAEERPA